MDYNINEFVTADDWEFCREIEGILRLQKQLTTHSQNERKLNAAFSPILKQRTWKGLTSDTIALIDTAVWKPYLLPEYIQKQIMVLSLLKHNRIYGGQEKINLKVSNFVKKE